MLIRIRVLRQTKRKVDDHFCSNTPFCKDIDRSAHTLYNTFADCHSQSVAGKSADRGIVLSFKRFKNMVDKLFTHADSVVPDGYFQSGITFGRRFLLLDLQTDASAFFGKLYSVVEQVQ